MRCAFDVRGMQVVGMDVKKGSEWSNEQVRDVLAEK